MRKLIKIEQIDSNRKYDFVILGNCNSPQHKEKKVNLILKKISYLVLYFH